INDIVSEIDRNRAALKRQVAKAERFLEYRRELDDLVLHDASHRLLELIVVDRVERSAYEAAAATGGELRDRLRAAEAVIDSARADAANIELNADEASQRAFEADNEVSSLHAEIERAKDRLTHLDQRLDSGRLELDELSLRRKASESELELLSQRVNELSG